jgi:hypothetical protein
MICVKVSLGGARRGMVRSGMDRLGNVFIFNINKPLWQG